jgi:DNA invertase Pin-like site-specific DNA recombinase
VSSLRVGYAWTSLFGDDAEGQRTELLALGVAADRVYLDVGLVGMTRPRPALAEALAALRRGDTLVVTALFRLARSATDAVDLLGRLVGVEVALAVGDVRQPLQGPALRMLVDGLEVAAELRSAGHSRRTRDGLRAAWASGQLTGRPPKMSPAQEQFVVESYLAGRFGASDLGELFGVSRSTVYRALRRAERASASRANTTW